MLYKQLPSRFPGVFEVIMKRPKRDKAAAAWEAPSPIRKNASSGRAQNALPIMNIYSGSTKN